MKIYTKTGDRGETSLFGGMRIPKDSLRIDAYGTVDELNSLIGLCRSLSITKEVDVILEQVQNDLFTLGADLATPHDAGRKTFRRIGEAEIRRLEHHIDGIEPTLEPLKSFVLPGGNQASATLHVARTVCRRAERLVVRLGREEQLGDPPRVFLNRLSDLLFVMARWLNLIGKTPETRWNPE